MIWVREAYGEAKGETKLRPKSRDMRMLREFHVVLDSGKEKKQSKTKQDKEGEERFSNFNPVQFAKIGFYSSAFSVQYRILILFKKEESARNKF